MCSQLLHSSCVRQCISSVSSSWTDQLSQLVLLFLLFQTMSAPPAVPACMTSWSNLAFSCPLSITWWIDRQKSIASLRHVVRPSIDRSVLCMAQINFKQIDEWDWKCCLIMFKHLFRALWIARFSNIGIEKTYNWYAMYTINSYRISKHMDFVRAVFEWWAGHKHEIFVRIRRYSLRQKM
jgi:hypothetical protein